MRAIERKRAANLSSALQTPEEVQGEQELTAEMLL
jgi:hypothetical protein